MLFSRVTSFLPSPVKQCPREEPGHLCASWG